jgi:hypothetical protein
MSRRTREIFAFVKKYAPDLECTGVERIPGGRLGRIGDQRD